MRRKGNAILEVIVYGAKYYRGLSVRDKTLAGQTFSPSVEAGLRDIYRDKRVEESNHKIVLTIRSKAGEYKE